jgi:hypothetical protein
MARLTDRAQPGSPPPARSPFLPPEPPPPALPPADPRLRQRAWAALFLAVLSLLAMMLIGNLHRAGGVAAVALAVAVTALVLAFRTLSAAKRTRTRRPRGAVAGAVLGVVSVLISGFTLLGFLLLGPQIDQYANCMSGASGSAAQQACQNQLDDSIRSKVGVTSR